MIDVEKIMKQILEVEMPTAQKEAGTRFFPAGNWITRRAVALTLRAVAEEIKLKWMLPERSISDFSMMLDAQAAAIEKGGG